ncbi:MAG: hypothetical protein QOF92_4092 [Pseudonocardiales bacterium]|jgi:uncharacterized protein (TIGR03086 family)|nr:hypothetical protein [Pseudonocardiales bacterium]MDT4951107.1 hypothetical protein [Pseudonocardiales bacterium]
MASEDRLQLFLAAQGAFSDRVHAVTEDQWQLGTPAVEWSVADLVRHLADEHQWAAPLMHGLDLDTAGKIARGGRSLPVDGGVGANFAELWDEAAAASADAFSAGDALDRTVELSRGRAPARDYIDEMTLDLVVHAWDLGRAIGYDEPLPAEVVEAVYAVAKDIGDLSRTGVFDKPVDVPDDAPTIDKLVALTGRDPR